VEELEKQPIGTHISTEGTFTEEYCKQHDIDHENEQHSLEPRKEIPNLRIGKVNSWRSR